jgi:hypothetical protein
MQNSQRKDPNEEKWGERAWKCGYTLCGFSAKSRDELYQHLEDVHGIKRQKRKG